MAGFGHPGGNFAQTADHGSSIAAFGPWKKTAIELLTVAVLWSQFSTRMKAAIKLLTLAVSWPLFIVSRFWFPDPPPLPPDLCPIESYGFSGLLGRT